MTDAEAAEPSQTVRLFRIVESYRITEQAQNGSDAGLFSASADPTDPAEPAGCAGSLVGHGRRHAAAPLRRRNGGRARDPLAGPVACRRHPSRPQSGRPSRRRSARGRRSPEAVHHGHVPVPLGIGPARRSPARLHRDRCLRPLQAHVGLQRAAHHGLRRLRPARRGACPPDWRASAKQHREQHREHDPPARSAGPWSRQTSLHRHHRRGLLPLDPVDLQSDLQRLVRPRCREGPSDRRTGSAVRLR